MLSMEAYKARMAQGLSFIEFNYQLLQAYDYLELHKRYKCVLELGGDDQWGNILAGVDLIRRVTGAKVEGLTVPLLTTASGAKMGKTAQGAVWLDPGRLSANDYYQFWINVADADVARFLRIFTTLPLTQISDGALQAAPIQAVKSVLAYECCALLHGQEAACAAHLSAQGAFGGKEIPADVVPASTVPRSAQSNPEAVPTLTLSAEQLAPGLSVVELLVTLGWCASNNAARRLIAQRSVRLADALITEANQLLTAADLQDGAKMLRAGKRRVHRLALGS
jgi:tyrosyl-tRNA synthetase